MRRALITVACVAVAGTAGAIASGAGGSSTAGGFGPPTPLASGHPTQSIAVLDFDGDGTLDVAAASDSAHRVVTLRAAEDGTYVPGTAATGLPGAKALSSGDFDGDGFEDLVVAESGDTTVAFLHGDGAGGFTRTGVSVGAAPHALAVADVDLDGDDDVLARTPATAAVVVVRNAGGRSYAAQAGVGVGGGSGSLALADINGDLVPDLVTVNDAEVRVKPGAGDGTFLAAQPTALPAPGVHIATADVDRDGFVDVAVGLSSTQVAVLRGAQSGTLGAATSYDHGGAPGGVLLADLDGDGDDDLAVSEPSLDRIAVRRNQTGAFGSAAHHPAGESPLGLATGALDGDGLPDLLAATSSDAATLLGSAPSADLQTIVTGPAGVVQPGAEVVYGVSVRNAGGDAARAVVLDLASEGGTLTSVVPAAACEPAGTTCDVGDLAPGAQVDLVVKVTSEASAKSTRLSVAADSLTRDANPADDAGSVAKALGDPVVEPSPTPTPGDPDTPEPTSTPSPTPTATATPAPVPTATPTPPLPLATTLLVRPRATAARTSQVVARGLKVSTGLKAAARVRLTLLLGKRKLGTKTLVAKRAGKLAGTLKLTRAGKKAVRGKRRPKLRLQITVESPGFRTGTRTLTVRLR